MTRNSMLSAVWEYTYNTALYIAKTVTFARYRNGIICEENEIKINY